MPVTQGKITRCDVRIPNNLYQEIEALAVNQFNAEIHWKSGKPEVSSTIVELLKYGIEYLSDRLSDRLSDKASDKLSDIKPMVEQMVSDILSDRMSDESSADWGVSRTVEELSLKVETVASCVGELTESFDRLAATVHDHDKALNPFGSIPELPSPALEPESPFFNGDVEAGTPGENLSTKNDDEPEPPGEKLSTKNDRGLSDRALALVLSVNPATVWKWRTRKLQPKQHPDFWNKWKWDDELKLWFQI
ncbi:hypothetical protein [Merismopedia glauca]|uniref:Uncharacterized protein n=1 Tax=Merismopedia glauca CCAP 1448/3 TaxID=1296344 RepID=A0A2T1BY34_9CYAN|nr:hypothetical protein [Merismopedia glauca]PSB00945.1 hypothetical protein C7B64_20875 [Merismopedia glauca CCAP 1448/3]